MAPHGVLLSVLQAVARQEAAGKAGPLKLARRVCVCVCVSFGEALSLLRAFWTRRRSPKAAPAGKAAPAPAPEVPEK